MPINTDTLFREEYSKLVAIYCHKYGTHHIDLIEDAIQDTFYKAAQQWPEQTPEKPRAWIYAVSKNSLLDKIKGIKDTTAPEEALQDWTDEPMNDYEIKDNKLKMLFACCHPELGVNDQLLLSLKFLCGFGNRQIARVLLKSHSAIEKASNRAKQRFQALVSSLEVPALSVLKERLDAVLKVIYLQFTEGYKQTEGDQLLNKELCFDSIKLAELIASFKELEGNKVNALLALMYFQASRLDARLDENGNQLAFEKQDRSQWNYHYIMQGNIYLSRSAIGPELSLYHLEAAIASYYAVAETYEETNWTAIFDLYQRALELSPNPWYRLNMLIAYSKIRSPEDCLESTLIVENELPKSHYTQIFIGDLLQASKKTSEARIRYLRALELTSNDGERKFIQEKLASL